MKTSFPEAKAALFKSLKVVLPCHFCRESYNQFYDELLHSLDSELHISETQVFATKCPEFVYQIHTMVDEKLRNQKLETFISFLDKNLEKDSWAMCRDNVIMLSSSFLTVVPSMEVVRKRFLLSEGRPFCEDSVFLVCLTLAMHSEEYGTHLGVRLFIESLKKLLSECPQYARLHGVLDEVDYSNLFSSIVKERGYGDEKEVRKLYEDAMKAKNGCKQSCT